MTFPARSTSSFPGDPREFLHVEDLAEAVAPRARQPLTRAWDVAASLMGSNVASAQILSETFRSVVVRFRTAQETVVAKHFRRRDAAKNASGFGFLRALHGAEALPGTARLLGADAESRLIFAEDVGHGAAVTAHRETFRSWIAAWPRLCLPADSPRAQAFRRRLAEADPEAARRGHPGALPSLGLLRRSGIAEADLRRLITPDHSVLWCGDMNPANFIHLPDRGFVQLDMEGTGYCDPGLLVAEVRGCLPSALDREGFLPLLPASEWDEMANHLADTWGVSPVDEIRGRDCLEALAAALDGPGR
ncbi:hypothetical protein [Curtobacterium sp. S6]|uniref:hypothetical protein n=1 Tax=Curtobacterium sp. S6 TaxID=1479623 RepID=UPI0004AB71B1|nr:hypothetical protein [Curtobacterium sp. S6]